MGREPKNENETLIQKQAFEYYYASGPTRGLRATAKHIGRSFAVIAGWSKKFKWQKRVAERDAKLGKKLEEETDKAVLDSVTAQVKDIEKLLNTLKVLVNDAIKKIEAKELSVENIKDLKRVFDSIEKYIRLMQDLKGKPGGTERVVIELQLPDGLREDEL